jgi:signal transduction histidine kinase
MTTPPVDGIPISLFELLRADLGATTKVVRCSKATLVHLSHTLEDLVLTRAIPAILFTGFQESSHWREETERYRALAEVAQQVCVFAGSPLPPESSASELHITLRGDDPLRQEWFVVILSSEFAVLLCGQDRLEHVDEEALRQFDTLWSFEPSLVNRVLDLLERVIAEYRPERLPGLQEARRRFTLTSPSAELMTQFSVAMIQFEEALQRALRQTNAELDAQLQWRDNLSQTLVHDLRTPLQGVVMALDILRHYADSDRELFEETLGIAVNNAQELETMIQTLLDTGQLEAGQLRLHWQPMPLERLAREVIEHMQPIATTADIALSLNVAPQVRDIWGDQQLLRRVLQNLLSNAIKFTPEGGRIGVEVMPGLSPGLVELRVRDNGAGIAPSLLPYLFERHFQGRNNDRRGAGLGLYFCRLVVEAHGGSIRADSQPSLGTTITALLPTKPHLTRPR